MNKSPHICTTVEEGSFDATNKLTCGAFYTDTERGREFRQKVSWFPSFYSTLCTLIAPGLHKSCTTEAS